MPGPGHRAIPSQAGRVSDVSPGSNKFPLALRTWTWLDEEVFSVFETPKNGSTRNWTLKGENTPHLLARQRLRQARAPPGNDRREAGATRRSSLTRLDITPARPQNGACVGGMQLLGFYICASMYSLIYVGEYIHVHVHRPTRVYICIRMYLLSFFIS